MAEFIKVKLESNGTAKFYCPHCNRVIINYTGSSNSVLPAKCPMGDCGKELDNTGVQPYTTSSSSSGGTGGTGGTITPEGGLN